MKSVVIQDCVASGYIAQKKTEFESKGASCTVFSDGTMGCLYDSTTGCGLSTDGSAYCNNESPGHMCVISEHDKSCF